MRMSHLTAVAVVLPRALWGPVEAVRRRHDRRWRRWPPHVNLLYPFLPPEASWAALGRLQASLAAVAPFAARLGAVGWFAHRGGCFTVWLQPEPVAAWVALYGALQAAFPGVGRRGPFRPHLSLGQARGRTAAKALAALAAGAGGGRWVVDRVLLLVRGAPPADRFRPRAIIPLQGASAPPR